MRTAAIVARPTRRAINRLIRTLCTAFEQSALVSYTATPFANIFIDEDGAQPGIRRGSVPALLHPPHAAAVELPRARRGLRRVRPPRIREGVEPPGAAGAAHASRTTRRWLEPGHKKDAAPGRLPDIAAARRSAPSSSSAPRGGARPGRRPQQHARPRHPLRRRPGAGRASRSRPRSTRCRTASRTADASATQPLDELRELWERDFVPTRREACRTELRGEPRRPGRTSRPQLPAAAARIRVARDQRHARATRSTYTDHPDGLRVIAVGGDKLSRGLTLEGLSVSYYLRASKMYDTLMQMGRWFGYRAGYADLVRLYTTGELQQLVPRHHGRERGAEREVRRDGAGRIESARLRALRSQEPGRTAGHGAGEDAQRAGRWRSHVLGRRRSRRSRFRETPRFSVRTRAGRELPPSSRPRAGDAAGERRQSDLAGVPGARSPRCSSSSTIESTARRRRAGASRHVHPVRVLQRASSTDWTVVLINNTQAPTKPPIALAARRSA